MKRSLVVRTLAVSEYEGWSSFVAGVPSGSIYALPGYLSALSEATDAQFSILAVLRGQELVGGMGLYEERTIGGSAASNRHLLYYHGPVVREYATRHPSERTSRQLEILGALADALQAWPATRLQLHIRHPITDMRPFQQRGWDVRPTYTYLVAIEDLTRAWDRVDQNLRRLVNRASALGLRFVEDDDFASFFRLHFDTHLRKGAPLYLPEAAFRRYFDRLRADGLCRLYQVRADDGRSVAAQLVLTGPHPIAHTVCAGADPAFLPLGSTPFLRWKAFESLSRAGYAANDLTGAGLGDVTRFKSQLGGDLVTNWAIARPDKLRYRLFVAAAAVRDNLRGLAAMRRHSSRSG